MDGSLTTWYAGQPVLTFDNTNDMSTWYAGQPFTYYEMSIVPPSTSHIKAVNGILYDNLKTLYGITIVNVKQINGIE